MTFIIEIDGFDLWLIACNHVFFFVCDLIHQNRQKQTEYNSNKVEIYQVTSKENNE